jgi:GMP synthase (glutamine-hydrolysing)
VPLAPSQYFAVIIDNVEDASHDSQIQQMQKLVAENLKVARDQVKVTVFEDKATGIREGNRVYSDVACVRVMNSEGKIHQAPIPDIILLQSKIIRENPTFTRVFYVAGQKTQRQPYAVAVRAIVTTDFLTAKVSEIPWKTLNEIAQNILGACSNVSTVCYDVTPKPPATVEME